MPIYEYTCEDCGKTFEKLVRTMSAASGADRGKIVICPACGSKNAARAQSVFAAQGSSKGADDAPPPPMCGRCGGAPGSCQLD
jgi:putative FmdB family regulatory protein